MFHGYDFDSTMLRIGSMNMLLHGVEQPDIRYRDSLSEGAAGEEGLYSLILANPPFAGSLDYESTSKELQRVVKTKKTELLFLALFLRLLKPGGRAAVIVPEGVLFGSSKAHKELRRILVEDQKLDAVVKLPSGVFRPYAGVSTAILLFTKTNSGGTDDVWFYDVQADGYSLDDKRNPVAANDLPDVLSRWLSLSKPQSPEKDRARTEQSFTVPKEDIVAQGYDLSLNRYKEIAHDEVEHRPPLEIIADIEALEDEIAQGPRRAEGHALVRACDAGRHLATIARGGDSELSRAPTSCAERPFPSYDAAANERDTSAGNSSYDDRSSPVTCRPSGRDAGSIGSCDADRRTGLCQH